MVCSFKERQILLKTDGLFFTSNSRTAAQAGKAVLHNPQLHSPTAPGYTQDAAHLQTREGSFSCSKICGLSSSQRVKCAFPSSPHHPVITASNIRGVSPCCFHPDLGCATLNFLLTGLKKQWLYIHTES